MGRGIQHGYSYDPVYIVWYNMIARCTKPNKDHYDRYGGRGIKVCDEWYDVKTFAEWAYKNGFKPGLRIDRIDNDGDYSPDNCRFITHKENLRNTSINKHLKINGEIKCLSEWAEFYGISYKALAHYYERHGEEAAIDYLVRGGPPENRKRVYCNETDTIYPSIRAAAVELGCDYTHVSHVCNGDAKSHHGHHFSFI